MQDARCRGRTRELQRLERLYPRLLARCSQCRGGRPPGEGRWARGFRACLLWRPSRGRSRGRRRDRQECLSYQLQGDPVVGVVDDVAKKGRGRIHVVEDHIDVAVVEDVAEGSAARANDGGQTAAGSRRDFLEFGTVEIAKKLRPLRPRRAPVAFVGDGVNVAVGDEEVEKAVVVEIEEAGAPAEKRNRCAAETGFERNVGEARVAVVAVKSFIVVGKCVMKRSKRPSRL